MFVRDFSGGEDGGVERMRTLQSGLERVGLNKKYVIDFQRTVLIMTGLNNDFPAGQESIKREDGTVLLFERYSVARVTTGSFI